MYLEQTLAHPTVSFCLQVPNVLRNPGYAFRRNA